jgi:hypothetical protein
MMKFALKWSVVVLFALTLAGSAVAQTKTTKKKTTTAAAAPAVTADDIRALRDALAAQAQQIQELKSALAQRDQATQQAQQQAQQAASAAAEAQQKATSAESVASSQNDTVTKLNADVADVKTTLTNTALNTQDDQKRFAALEGLVGRFRWTGDVRVRGESFFQSALPGTTGVPQDRQRARLRVRLGLEGKVGEDFVGGLALATGSLGDPTTTNETMTNFFDRKTIALDKAYITYNPKYFKWVTVTSGKFTPTWQKTNNTFDPDLNPEGFAVKFSYDPKGLILKNVSVQPIVMFFSESSGGVDSYAPAVQFSGRFQIGPWTATPSYMLTKWNNPDAILNASAFAVQATTAGTPPVQVPGEGPGCSAGSPNSTFPAVPPCVFAPNRLTNATYRFGTGQAHFYSQFFYSDIILNNQIKTPWARLPINLVLEYLDNLDAQDHPLGTTGNLNVLTSLGRQSHLYLADFSVGQARNKHDLQVGYSWWRQEQDSVIASFDESDQRAPTNILQNKFYVNWKPTNNITAGYTLWVGRTLNGSLQNAALAPGSPGTGLLPGQTEPYLKRMQFDLVYAF